MAALVATMRWRESGLRSQLARDRRDRPAHPAAQPPSLDPKPARLMHRAGHGGEDLAAVMFDIDPSSASTTSTAT
jgi:hypothetical protein